MHKASAPRKISRKVPGFIARQKVKVLVWSAIVGKSPIPLFFHLCSNIRRRIYKAKYNDDAAPKTSTDSQTRPSPEKEKKKPRDKSRTRTMFGRMKSTS